MSPGGSLVAAIAAKSLVKLAIAVWAEPLVAAATRAADQLLQPDAYVRAVLANGR
jgi:hypothetical protein